MHVVHIIARLNDGGPARVLRELAREHVAAGVRVDVLCGRVEGDERDLTAEVAASGAGIHLLPAFGRRLTPLGDVRSLAGLVRLLGRLRPDLVHTHTAKAGALGRIAARWRRRPCLHTYHGHVLYGYFPYPVNAAIRLSERLLATLGHCHTLTPALVTELRDRFAIGRHWHHLPVPVAPVLPRAGAWHRDLPSDRPVIGFLGRLAPVKDAPLFLEVVARLQARRPVIALVCGDGGMRETCEALARRLGVDARFTGFVPAAEALAAMDCLLVTSRNEGQPLAAIEAAGAGVPVVATAVGGLVDLARWGLVTAVDRNPEDLAAAANRALDGRSDAHRPSLARRAASRFAPAILAPRYLELYRQVITACRAS